MPAPDAGQALRTGPPLDDSFEDDSMDISREEPAESEASAVEYTQVRRIYLNEQPPLHSTRVEQKAMIWDQVYDMHMQRELRVDESAQERNLTAMASADATLVSFTEMCEARDSMLCAMAVPGVPPSSALMGMTNTWGAVFRTVVIEGPDPHQVLHVERGADSHTRMVLPPAARQNGWAQFGILEEQLLLDEGQEPGTILKERKPMEERLVEEPPSGTVPTASPSAPEEPEAPPPPPPPVSYDSGARGVPPPPEEPSLPAGAASTQGAPPGRGSANATEIPEP